MSTDSHTWIYDGMFGCWIRLPANTYHMYDSAALSIQMSPNTTIEEKRGLLFQTIRNLGGVFVPRDFAAHVLSQAATEER